MRHFAASIAIILSVPCCGQNWQWAKAPFTEGDNAGKAVAVHPNGFFFTAFDVYTSVPSSYQGQPINCSGEGGTLAKHDMSGNVIWVQKTGARETNAVTTDAGGNAYIGGSCAPNSTF